MQFETHSEAEERIRAEVKRNREQLEDQLARENGAVTARDAVLLDTLDELVRERLWCERALKGEGQTVRSSGSSVIKDNKCFPQMQKVTLSIIRVLNTLFPPKRAAASADGGDADGLDDY